MNDFAIQLENRLTALPQRSPSDDAILGILQAPDSPRKKRQLKRMERHARRHLGFADKDAVDWSAINWSSVLATILQVLAAILPLLLLL